MLWLINQATAGDITGQMPAITPGNEKKDDKKEGILSNTGQGASFSDFKIDANA
ncbi:hypothetical protein D3C83_316230 [compost metagenome]